MPRYLKSSTQSPVSTTTSPSNTGSTIPLTISGSALFAKSATILLVSTLTKWSSETLGNGSRVLGDSKPLKRLAVSCALFLALLRIAMLLRSMICSLVARLEAMRQCSVNTDRNLRYHSKHFSPWMSCCVMFILRDIYATPTYGHSQLKTGHPVRSAIHKQLNGRLVLRWVTTWESLLLYVLFCFASCFSFCTIITGFS
jgi:hypothetical protein